MIKYKQDNLVYYFATEEHFNNAISSPDFSFKLTANANFVIDERSNALIKCRATLEDLIDNAVQNQYGFKPELRTSVVDWGPVRLMIKAVIDNLMQTPNLTGSMWFGLCLVEYDTRSKHVTIFAPRRSGKTRFVARFVETECRNADFALLKNKDRWSSISLHCIINYLLLGRSDPANHVVFLDEFDSFPIELDSLPIDKRPIQVRITTR